MCITFKQSIVNRVTQLASESGMTISRLAIKSGMAPATLYDIIKTNNKNYPI